MNLTIEEMDLPYIKKNARELKKEYNKLDKVQKRKYKIDFYKNSVLKEYYKDCYWEYVNDYTDTRKLVEIISNYLSHHGAK